MPLRRAGQLCPGAVPGSARANGVGPAPGYAGRQ